MIPEKNHQPLKQSLENFENFKFIVTSLFLKYQITLQRYFIKTL